MHPTTTRSACSACSAFTNDRRDDSPGTERKPVAPVTETPPTTTLSRTMPEEAPPSMVSEALQAPYPVPAACPVTTMALLEEREGVLAYWLDGEGLSMGVAAGLFFEADQPVWWQTATPEGPPQVTGERLEGPEPEPGTVALHDLKPLTPEVWAASLVFPSPGCWRLYATAGIHRFEAVLYVYPAIHRPAATDAEPSTGPL